MKSPLFLIAAAALLWLNADARDILIRDAKVHSVSDRGTIEHADVLVRDGRIAAVGTGLSAEGAEIVEARNRPLTPGFFGGLTAIGLVEVSGEQATNDASISFGAPVVRAAQ